MLKATLLIASMGYLGLAAPNPLLQNNSAVSAPAALLGSNQQCDGNTYGCSACSECCVLKYTTSPTGCSALGDPQTPLYGVAKPGGDCHDLLVGVYAAKVHESTRYFDHCLLWSETGCKGVQDTLTVDAGNCRGPFLVRSVECFGVYGPEDEV